MIVNEIERQEINLKILENKKGEIAFTFFAPNLP